MNRRLFRILLFYFVVSTSCSLTNIERGYGIIVGKDASTDGRIYLAHNSFGKGEQMLNIYNIPSNDSTCKTLWFEFPGLHFSDTYLNKNDVAIAIVPSSLLRSRKVESERFYHIIHNVATSTPSADNAAKRIKEYITNTKCKVNAVVMIADCHDGWLCTANGKGRCEIQRVPDNATMYVGKCGITYPKIEQTEEKHHRTDLCKHVIEIQNKKGIALLTNVFCFDPKLEPQKGSCAYASFPGQTYGFHSLFTPGTTSPDCCHRYASVKEAIDKHFTDTQHFYERWPNHFYNKYLYPENDINVTKHDFIVYLPSNDSDIFNDHFHVIDDPKRGLLYAFWTRGTYEGSDDMHVVFSRSEDHGYTWTTPKVLAGPTNRENPTRRAAWQQPMLSRNGRLYCLWNQETTSKNILCGTLWGRYSDDGGLTWSKAEKSPLSLRADTDAEDTNTPPVWCNWQRPLRLGENGKFIVGSSRHGKAPYDKLSSCKVEFWQYENIDDDPEIRDIRISIFSNNRNALSADSIKSVHAFVGSDGLAVEEASIVGLPDGRLFALIRSSIGHPVWSQSRDNGKTWDKPKILRMADGSPVLHPRSPCPMYDVMGPEARSGRYVAFVHHTFDFDGSTSYQFRGPLYRIDGVFDPNAEQPVQFTPADVFTNRECLNSMYSSYTPSKDGGILWFNDRKHYLFGRKIK